MPRLQPSISIYRVRREKAKSIYGITTEENGDAINNDCSGCEPAVSYIDTMTTFVSFLESLTTSIKAYFPKANILSPLIADLTVKGTMNLAFYTRVLWSKKYTTMYNKFDVHDVVHVNLLKDIFLELGYDWHIDKWLNKWPNI
jgi:hypothetical protein